MLFRPASMLVELLASTQKTDFPPFDAVVGEAALFKI
jgi:hypothetical protein